MSWSTNIFARPCGYLLAHALGGCVRVRKLQNRLPSCLYITHIHYKTNAISYSQPVKNSVFYANLTTVEPRNTPFNFIFDYLLPLDITVNPLFGMFYVYTGPRIILVLRDRKDQPEMNGIWVATNKGQQESLKKELPVLRAFSGPKSRDSGNGWQMIPKDAPDF